MGIGRYVTFIHELKFDLYKYKYRRKNKHNNTIPGNQFDINKVSVGNNTYGILNIVDFSDKETKVCIGAYCSIAAGVQLLLGGEHKMDTISTFPFKAEKFGYCREADSKGNIIIGDDVWICQNAIICSGVTIGQGAVIGTGAVITKDVPPYAIVAGNPGKIIKYRFDRELRDKLVNIDIGKLFDRFTKQDLKMIYSSNEKDILFLIQKYNF